MSDARDVTMLLDRTGFRIDTRDRACPGGLMGRLFGHDWLTCDQIEINDDPSDGRPFKVYTAQRCKRCYGENGAFGRVYAPRGGQGERST